MQCTADHGREGVGQQNLQEFPCGSPRRLPQGVAHIYAQSCSSTDLLQRMEHTYAQCVSKIELWQRNGHARRHRAAPH
eukprot:8681711-Prorocentrum_lima.AAC.1